MATKPGNKNKGGPKAGAAGSGSSDQRLAALEQKIGVPHEVQDFLDRLGSKRGRGTASLRAVKTFDALSDDAVAPAELTNVIFDMQDTKLTLVRVFPKEGGPDIVDSAQPHGVLPQKMVGDFVHLVIQVQGDADDEVVITVQNATPNIRMKGKEGPFAIKTLFVTGADT